MDGGSITCICHSPSFRSYLFSSVFFQRNRFSHFIKWLQFDHENSTEALASNFWYCFIITAHFIFNEMIAIFIITALFMTNCSVARTHHYNIVLMAFSHGTTTGDTALDNNQIRITSTICSYIWIQIINNKLMKFYNSDVKLSSNTMLEKIASMFLIRVNQIAGSYQIFTQITECSS